MEIAAILRPGVCRLRTSKASATLLPALPAFLAFAAATIWRITPSPDKSIRAIEPPLLCKLNDAGMAFQKPISIEKAADAGIPDGQKHGSTTDQSENSREIHRWTRRVGP